MPVYGPSLHLHAAVLTSYLSFTFIFAKSCMSALLYLHVIFPCFDEHCTNYATTPILFVPSENTMNVLLYCTFLYLVSRTFPGHFWLQYVTQIVTPYTDESWMFKKTCKMISLFLQLSVQTEETGLISNGMFIEHTSILVVVINGLWSEHSNNMCKSTLYTLAKERKRVFGERLLILLTILLLCC